MTFEYLISQKKFEENIDEFWRVDLHRRIVFWRILMFAIFLCIPIFIYDIYKLIPDDIPYIYVYANLKYFYISILAIIMAYGLFYFLGLISLKRSLKRKFKKNRDTILTTMSAMLGMNKKMHSDTDSTKIVLSYDEKYLYTFANDKKYKNELKDFIIKDVGTAYCIYMIKKRKICANAFFVIPKYVKITSLNDKEYKVNVSNFINNLAPKTKNKKIKKWYASS